jgi:hypothetical protein
MPKSKATKLSHGGRYYRAHRARENDRKRVERGRIKGFLSAYKDRNPDYRGTVRDLLRAVRGASPDGKAHLPSHSSFHVSRREQEYRRKTTERFLGLDYAPSEFESRYGGRG